jgi:hypothetical protein
MKPEAVGRSRWYSNWRQLEAGWSRQAEAAADNWRQQVWQLEAAAGYWRQRPVENQFDGEFGIVKTYNTNRMFESFQDQFRNYKFIKQVDASMKVSHFTRRRFCYHRLAKFTGKYDRFHSSSLPPYAFFHRLKTSPLTALFPSLGRHFRSRSCLVT